jgi:CRP/FNR family transcriptional regulator, cyclic AMP receptor protein
MASLEELLAASLWFKELDAPARAQVGPELIERSFAAGGYVCRKGEPVEHWVGVVEGLLKLSNVSPVGKAVTLTGVPALGWFGEGSLLKQEARRYDAIALRDSRVALMPRATFQRLLDTSITFNRFLLTQLNERLALFISTLEHERLLGTDARIARCLASLFNPILYPGIGQRIAVSQEEIGFLSGVSRQRVNQALQVLEREGLLRVEYGGLTILDLERLRSYGT